MTNYYKILGVKDFASLEEIKTAYRKLSKKFHPDVNDGDKFFEERFKEIQEAYEKLTNSRQKEIFDGDLKKSGTYTKTDTSQQYYKEQPAKEETQNKEKYKKKPEPKSEKARKGSRLSFWAFILLIPIIIVLYMVFKENSKHDSSGSSNKESFNNKPHELNSFDLRGTANNRTFNKISGVELFVERLHDKIYRCKGNFDEKTLYGNFDILGEDVATEDSSKSLDLVFNGEIHFGDNDNSGFSPGTKTAFRVTLNIFPDTAVGSYFIDTIFDSKFQKLDQKGTFKLDVYH